MTAPDPRDVDRMTREITSLLGEITPAYRWVHSFGYFSTRAPESLDAGPAPHHAGSVSDPTGGIVTSAEKVSARRAMVNCTDTMEEAIAALRSARYVLTHALPDREPMPSEIDRRDWVNRKELAESRAAKLRREARLEGWGSG